MAALFRKIQKADFSYPSWFTEEVKDLLDKILVVDPRKRWGIKQIMTHSWWKKDGPYATCPDIDATGVSTTVGSPNGSGAVGAGVSSSSSSSAVPMETDSGSNAPGSVVKDVDENESSAASPSASVIKSEFPRRVNAFSLINMCSGSAINRMLQSGEEKSVRKMFMYASSKPHSQVMSIIQEKFSAIAGFLEQKAYKNDSKLRAVFDFGRGHVHVKVAIKIASTSPNLCLIVFKRARGDLISFNKNIAASLDSIAASVDPSTYSGGSPLQHGSNAPTPALSSSAMIDVDSSQ